MTLVPLTRAALALCTGAVSTPPVRIVHLGLGAFHRAHQAWYTAQVDDATEWGIAAFTGRSPEAATQLIRQDGLFTLIERSGGGDTATLVTSIVEAVDGADCARLAELIASPVVSIVTLTITEAGYRLTPDALPNLADAAVTADLARLKVAFGSGRPLQQLSPDAAPVTALGRLLLGLEARRRAQAGPIAVVPCDNMPDNGRFVATGLVALARLVDGATAAWIEATVSFVSTSVDRITPRTTDADLATAGRLTGWQDNAAVVTEPFTDWVLCGEFPAGRPAWERAGVRFVDDIEPFERRKLWLLNGAHSLVAYAGLLRGHETVAAAMSDSVVRGWVNDLWDAAMRHLPTTGLALEEYRGALLTRFDNARIEHRLVQISAEGVTKLRVRIAPTLLAEREAGRDGAAGVRALGSWAAVLLSGRVLVDGDSALIAAALEKPHEHALSELIALIDPRLAADDAVMAGIRAVIAASEDDE